MKVGTPCIQPAPRNQLRAQDWEGELNRRLYRERYLSWDPGLQVPGQNAAWAREKIRGKSGQE